MDNGAEYFINGMVLPEVLLPPAPTPPQQPQAAAPPPQQPSTSSGTMPSSTERMRAKSEPSVPSGPSMPSAETVYADEHPILRQQQQPKDETEQLADELEEKLKMDSGSGPTEPPQATSSAQEQLNKLEEMMANIKIESNNLIFS